MCFQTLRFVLCSWFIGVTMVATAQTNLFLPFGDTRQDVISYLETRDYVKDLTDDQDLNVVRIVLSSRKQVEYAFHGNQLYAVTVLHNYTDLAEAERATGHLIEYLRSCGAPEIKKTGEGSLTVYTAITSSRVLKVFVRTHSNSKTLILSSISLAHGPDMKEEDFFYEEKFFNAEGEYVLKGGE